MPTCAVLSELIIRAVTNIFNINSNNEQIIFLINQLFGLYNVRKRKNNLFDQQSK